jgi:beta-phosphoglucomutase
MSRAALGAIFDMDGVLIDSTEAHFAAWSRLGDEVGVPMRREIFEGTFGMHNRQILPLWLGDHLESAEIERLSERKEAMFRKEAPSSVRALDGAVELVEQLDNAGFALAVGSSGPRANVELILDLLGVRARFDALATGDDVHHGKPDPEVFLTAAARLSLPPGSCAVIEDAPQGIQAGLRAGCRVIAVASTRPRSELGAAHLVVESLREVRAGAVQSLLAAGVAPR